MQEHEYSLIWHWKTIQINPEWLQCVVWIWKKGEHIFFNCYSLFLVCICTVWAPLFTAVQTYILQSTLHFSFMNTNGIILKKYFQLFIVLLHLLSVFAVKMRHACQHKHDRYGCVSIFMQQMTPHWPPHQNSCSSLSRYHPVATIIPHGRCSRDYHGDNPEVEGSVPGAGPPILQARSPGATLLALQRMLFTSCHFKVAKWTKQNTNSKEYKMSAITSGFLDHAYSAAIIG